MSLHTEDRNVVMEFTRKPASRILVNTGSSMGGTGASTGLLPSFTLGCGTWGGSSVSENVSPLHLINMKKVAYGIKNCATLAADDPTFNHPELAGCASGACTPGAAVTTSSCGRPVPVPPAAPIAPTSAPNCGSTSRYLSPAEYQNNNNSGITYSACCGGSTAAAQAPAASDQPIDREALTDMINELVKAMKGE